MEAHKEQSQCSSHPRVPDSRLPGVEPTPDEDIEEHTCNQFSALALWPVGILLTIAILTTISTVWYGPTQVLQVILRYLMPERPQVWHGVAIWAAIVVCITCAIPVLMLLLPVPALVFGFWKGFLITFMGLMCAATLSFAIGRSVARRPVRRYLEGERWTRIMRLLRVMEDADSMRLLVLYRFLPIPMGIRNYGPAILRVPIPNLVLASIPHSLWSAFVFAMAGSTLKGPAELLRDGNKIEWRTPEWQQGLGLVIALSSFLLFTWIAWRAYAKAEEEEECQTLAKNAEGGHYGTASELVLTGPCHGY